MTTVRVAIGAMWVVAFLAGREFSVPDEPLPIAATSAEITRPAAVPSREVIEGSLVEPRDSDEPPVPRFDLFGNEIEEAVADYRVDQRGGIYERHSPDTAVPKLGLPKT
jgi:hypothetical protein